MSAKMLQKIVTLSLVTCGIHVMPDTARALSCATNWIPAPAQGDVGVPTNTLIWAHGRFGGASPARLIGPAGEVPVEERFFTVAISVDQGTNYPVLVPEAELEPDTTYRIETSYEDISGVVTTESVSFTTGSGPLTSAPLPPQITSSEPGAGNGWEGGVNRYLRLGVAHEGILIADNAGALGTIESAQDLWLPERDADFESVPLASGTRVVRWATLDSELWVGLGDCMVWPETAADREQARFGVLDLAGNFSGWTGPVELTLPSVSEAESIIASNNQAREEEEAARYAAIDFQKPKSGCTLSAAPSSTERSAWGLAALALALGVAARRRRG